MPYWIDGNGLAVGDAGFLVEVCPQGQAVSYRLQDRPVHTNQSREPKLHGWCGETNNVSRYARGMARVSRIARNGRALVVEIVGAELREALEDLGYPELVPYCVQEH